MLLNGGFGVTSVAFRLAAVGQDLPLNDIG